IAKTTRSLSTASKRGLRFTREAPFQGAPETSLLHARKRDSGFSRAVPQVQWAYSANVPQKFRPRLPCERAAMRAWESLSQTTPRHVRHLGCFPADQSA